MQWERYSVLAPTDVCLLQLYRLDSSSVVAAAATATTIIFFVPCRSRDNYIVLSPLLEGSHTLSDTHSRP
jgi:hypothetical protein